MKCRDKNCDIYDRNHNCFRNSNWQLHREDGPALIWAGGAQEWYINGKWHREDGPALIFSNEYQLWYVNGKLVR